ncbi:MAG: hypothetical protein ACE5H0_15315 [Bacteroidota bacterium]
MKDDEKAGAKNESRESLETTYTDMQRRAEEEHPGINELLKLYGEFQAGFRQSQEYLQLLNQKFVSSTSNNSAP